MLSLNTTLIALFSTAVLVACAQEEPVRTVSNPAPSQMASTSPASSGEAAGTEVSAATQATPDTSAAAAPASPNTLNSAPGFGDSSNTATTPSTDDRSRDSRNMPGENDRFSARADRN